MELQSLKKIQKLVGDIKVGMFATITKDLGITSRPMGTQEIDDEGNVWFFTSDESGKLVDIIEHPKVCLSYSSPEKNSFLSLRGIATAVADQEKMKELFSPLTKAWFPKGLEDPTLILIKFHIHEAEYWDGTSNKLVQAFKVGKALVTGERYENGEHEKLVN